MLWEGDVKIEEKDHFKTRYRIVETQNLENDIAIEERSSDAMKQTTWKSVYFAEHKFKILTEAVVQLSLERNYEGSRQGE